MVRMSWPSWSRCVGEVWLPDALQRKYVNAAREFAWQYVFPAALISVDPRSDLRRRHHLEAPQGYPGQGQTFAFLGDLRNH